MIDIRQNKCTQRAQEAVFEAQSQAGAFNHSQIEPEHLLLALPQQDEGVAPQIVRGLGRNPTELQARVKAELQLKSA